MASVLRGQIHVPVSTLNAADRLIEKIDEKKNPIVVGLDPRVEYIPRFIVDPCISELGETRKAMAESFLDFSRAVIDQIESEVAIVKPQVAFYEQLGGCGFEALTETIMYARNLGLMVILDAKRNDIGSTAEAYSNAYLGRFTLDHHEEAVFDVDFLTVNPYLGSDSIRPFVDDARRYDKGIFVLVRTSNPSSKEFQGLRIGRKRLHDYVLEKVVHWGRGTIGSHGYSSVGAVVGATHARDFATARADHSDLVFLVPGYGAQGGTAKDVIHLFNKDGYGAIISSSRQITFDYSSPSIRKSEFEAHIRDSVREMRTSIAEEMRARGIYPWK